MKEEVFELYREGHTISEIADETGLAPSSVGAYIYASKINKDPIVQEVQMRAQINNLIKEYELKFGKFTLY